LYIDQSPQVDFIPLEALTEFPNLIGLLIDRGNLPTLKEGLFKSEFQNIEYLFLATNNIKTIEPKAFEFLIKLKWIYLWRNQIHTLSYRFFKNNPNLIFIYFVDNKIGSIHPHFFDGLNHLKYVSFKHNRCINVEIGCDTCLITESDLKGNLTKCYENCAAGSECDTEYLAHET
jgi:hypothetical protein